MLEPTPVPGRSSNYRPLTITSGIRSSAGRTPNKIALVEGDKQLTFRQFVDRIDRVTAGVMGDLGLSQGDIGAILAPNCLEFFELVCGSAEAGVPLATVNPKLSPDEILSICDDCGAKVLFVHPSLEALARSIRFETVKRIIVIAQQSYEDWLAACSPGARPYIEEWSTFVIHYTSGTTGKPKGVLLPHRARTLNFFANAVEYGCYTPYDRYLGVSPIYFGAGLAFAISQMFFGGTTEVLPDARPEIVLRKLTKSGATSTFLVPTHFHQMFGLEQKLLDECRGNTLKTIVSNAAPLPQATKELIVDYFGDGILHETYGSTEGAIVTNLRPEFQLTTKNCAGTAFPCTTIKLLDDDGNEVPDGEVGEIFASSPYLFNGYHNRPEETAAAFVQGMFSAGDLGIRDANGFYSIVDRKKDMVISGGVNIYPREIEEVLFRAKGVAEAAVIGVPDPTWGEALKAYIVLQPGVSPDPDGLLKQCESALARYKLPKSFAFVDALPKNATGKILKRDLRLEAIKQQQ